MAEWMHDGAMPLSVDLSSDPGTAQDPRAAAAGATPPDQDPQVNRVLVVTPEGMALAAGDESNPAALVEQPAKVMRIGSMIKQLLEEVRNAPLDEAGRARLAAIHERSIAELKKGLAPELVSELEEIALPFDQEDTPSDAELRIAQAQLVGWLEGLFHGIQTVLFAQQMAARAQLEQMRRALPPGTHPPINRPEPRGDPETGEQGTGQYL
jgi:hypothetical protein